LPKPKRLREQGDQWTVMVCWGKPPETQADQRGQAHFQHDVTDEHYQHLFALFLMHKKPAKTTVALARKS